jgi:uncharacterized membrane protein
MQNPASESSATARAGERPKRGIAAICLALAAITLIALGLRVWHLGSESAWWDEVASLKYLDAPTLTAFLQNERATDPPMTPVYFTIQYYWSRLVGTSVLRMRLLSVLLGLLTIQMLFMLTRRLYGDTAGLISSLFLALSLLHIYYSQEIRVYALVLLLSLISMYAFIGILEGGRAGCWAMHLAANLLVVFTHLFAILLIATQACFLLVCQRHEKRLTAVWIACHSVIGLFMGAWVLTINTAMLNQAASWMVKPGLREIGMFWLVFAGGRASNENPATHLPSGMSLDIPLAALLLLLILWFAWKRLVSPPLKGDLGGCTDSRTDTIRVLHPPESPFKGGLAYPLESPFKGGLACSDRSRLVLLLMWLVIPPAVLCVVSYAARPCFMYRYVLYSSLPVYMLSSMAVTSMRSLRMRRTVAVVVALLYAYQLSALAAGPFRPDWQSVSRYLETNASPDDSILVFQDINLIALEFNSTLPKNHMRHIPVWSELCGPVMAAHTAGRDVWFVVWMWSDPGKLEACFLSNDLKFSHSDFAGWPNLRVYHLPGDRSVSG